LEYSHQVTIENELGFHARACATFVKLAQNFQAEIWVEKNGVRVNGKSIMDLLMLAAPQGSQIKIIARGPDAQEALEKLAALVSQKFGENH
jgi:phosphocarrier protein